MLDQLPQLTTEISALEITSRTQASQEEPESRSEPRDTESISAVDRIPTELICEIFALTLPYLRRIGNYSIEQAPWRLGHICQRWRAAALENPRFWSSITLYAPPPGWRGQACPPLMIATQLLRSGNAPLHVLFDSRHADIIDSCSPESIDLVLGQSPRWETARLRLHHAVAPRLGNRLRTVKGNIPVLHSLEFIAPQHFDFIIGDTFSIAPSLRAVILTDDDHSALSISPKAQLPWSQITNFRGYYPLPQDCAAILKAVPNVVECGMSSYPAHPPVVTPIVLPYLLRFSTLWDGDILTSVTAPSLQELWVSGSAAAPLLGFIQRSSCPLRKLVVYECSDPASLIPILQAIPTLRTFFVVFMRTVNDIHERTLFDALKIRGSPSDICPGLTHIAAEGPLRFAVDRFVNMAESRWYTVDRPVLSFMRAVYHDEMPRSMLQDAMARVDKMREEGLDAAVDRQFGPSQQNYLGIGRP